MSDIANANPILIRFEAPESDTLEESGAKSVRMRIYRSEIQWATVMLVVTADAKKLEAYVIFKRKCMPKEKFRRVFWSV